MDDNVSIAIQFEEAGQATLFSELIIDNVEEAKKNNINFDINTANNFKSETEIINVIFSLLPHASDLINAAIGAYLGVLFQKYYESPYETKSSSINVTINNNVYVINEGNHKTIFKEINID